MSHFLTVVGARNGKMIMRSVGIVPNIYVIDAGMSTVIVDIRKQMK
jgi:hypothetical protein